MHQDSTLPGVDPFNAASDRRLRIDAQLDTALADSFPASDPPALLRRGSMEAAGGAPGKRGSKGRHPIRGA